MKRTRPLIETSIGRPQKSSGSALVLVVFFLVSFGIASTTQGVTPAPDGGYPAGNTAEGQAALLSLTTGGFNTAVGFLSLRSNTTGSSCTAIGAGTLLANTADNNTATGAGALLSNTTGEDNTANGAFALFSNAGGAGNTATGTSALFSNTSGSDNTANGTFALLQNTGGASNTATGRDALFANTTGSNNTATGRSALGSNSTGSDNTAVGLSALASSTTGNNNTAMGRSALGSNSVLDNNTAVGFTALAGGGENTAIGSGALASNSLFDNTAIGYQALYREGGSYHTAIGSRALANATTGLDDIAIGAGAGFNVTTASNVICIAALGANVDRSCYIEYIWNQTGGSQAVYVNSEGKLGFQTSSRRFKEDIKPMDYASELIYALKPVSFRYKPEIEPTRTRGFGLIAEEVEKISPDLVTRGDDGQPNSVHYDAVNAMLLNEFLKEHKKVEAQQGKIEKQEHEMQIQRESITQLKWTVAQQEKQLQWLSAGLQRVTAQVEIGRDKPKMARNNW